MRKNKQSPVVFAKKPAVVATQVALAVMAQFAYAQQQVAERVERVEITGTRLPALNVEGPSPVTVMDAQEIRMDGLSKTEDLLNNLPQVFANQTSAVSNGATGTANVNLRNLGQVRPLSSRPQPLARQFTKRQHQVRDRRTLHIEQVQIEMKAVPGLYRPPIQMVRSKDKRTRPIRQPARTGGKRRRLKHPRVGTRLAYLAATRPGAVRHARNPPEYVAKRAAQNIGRFTRRKINRLARAKRKTQRI